MFFKKKTDVVTLAPPTIDANPPVTEIATFALGWFWGPDSQFGSIPGVIRTRVGYTGGTKSYPTYHSMGDHTETLQIDYDPDQISYEKLLELFWKGHNPTYRPWSRQYMSALFFYDDEQRALALQTKDQEEAYLGKEIHTEIAPVSEFYLAENYHQKYMAQNSKKIWNDVKNFYPNPQDWINSSATARLNGYVAGYGLMSQLENEIDSLGLSPPGQEELRRIAGRFGN